MFGPPSHDPPGEGWEGQQHTKTPAAPLVAQYVALGCSQIIYLGCLEEQHLHHYTTHHLLASKAQFTVDPLSHPTLAGPPP